MPGECEAGLAEGLPQNSKIAARGGDAFAEACGRRGAELNLATWLLSEQAGAGERSWPLKAAQDMPDLIWYDGQLWFSFVSDEPLELGPDYSWWAGFKGNCSD
jgi:hypothetical protein